MLDNSFYMNKLSLFKINFYRKTIEIKHLNNWNLNNIWILADIDCKRYIEIVNFVKDCKLTVSYYNIKLMGIRYLR